MNATAPVVALHRAPPEVEARVREACLRAGADVLASDALDARKPALLVAHLPKRGRRIPAEVLEVASRFDVPLPILLACDETLVHPATTLRVGAVTLVEHAATERLYSQIRIVLTAARAGADAPPREAPVEQADPDWWLATIAGEPRTHIARDDSGSVTLLLPFGTVADPVSLLGDAHEVIASAPDVVSSLASCIGGNAGLVHLARETRAWMIYWPPSKGGLRLFSSHRLPHLSSMSCTDAPRIFRSPMAPGEIVVATSRPLDADDYDVLAGLADGGPVTVERLRALSNPPAGFVVEVRVMDGARLLVIDDSPTIRKLIELTFRGTEWTVTFATSAREGIASATASPPDLIALDYVLPDLRGIDVCARLAGEPATRDVPIVVITAKSDEVRQQFESYPAVMACLPKPFTAAHLRKIADAAIANLTPSTPRAPLTPFTREQREQAAQTIFGRLRSALGNVPRWSGEIRAAPPATFYARKLLTLDRVDAILEGLLPLYREVVASTSAPAAPSLDAGSAAMSGELRAWPIGELLNFFAASGRVGELRLVHGERTLLTYWRRGEIILVTTLDPDEYLRGVPLGRLAPEALTRAKAEQRATGRPAFVTLAEEGTALPSSLGDLLYRQGRRLLLDAIDSKAATFAWRDIAALPLYVEAHGRHISTARNTLVLGATSPDAPHLPAASLEQLALERLRREPGSAPFSDDAVFDRVRGFTSRIRRFELDANERRVLAAINGANAVCDVAARVSLPIDQVRLVLARLADVDLVTERDLADGDVGRPVFILDPDVDGFQRPLETLLRSRAVESPFVSLADEQDIVGAIRREHPRLVILNAAVAGGLLADTARAVRATGGLGDVSLVAVLESDCACDADALRAAGFDAVFVKPVPYADLERLID